MYMFEEMIDMGLKLRQKWPTPAHRVVAVNIAICNPLIFTRTAFNDVVQKVCKIPKSKIKTVTLAEMPKYGLEILVR